MTYEETLAYMKNTPWNYYYVCDNPNDPASWEAYRVRREKLDWMGSDICTMSLPRWWVDIDTYDFRQLDCYVEALLKDHSNRWLIPRLEMQPPDNWLRAHPEEVCLYENCTHNLREIANMIGTPQHDRSGCDDGRQPHPDQRLSNQSISSKLWVEDASKALKALVEHLENGPYGKQVLAYFPGFANCGENMWWGDWRNHGDIRRGDFGISHRKHFFDWAVEKYGSLAALRKAWNMPGLTRENLPIPTGRERWSYGKDLGGILLINDQRQVDCNEFHSKVTFDALEAFGKVIKDLTGKPVGCFYGYLQDDTVGYAGHTAFERAMNTPYLDFYSSPKGYHYCLAGEPGTSQTPAQSFSRKKLWIEENDMRSYHAMKDDPTRAPENFEESFTCFWREIYRALTFKQGFWWMDIWGLRDDWYADEDLNKMFKHQSDFYRKWAPIPRKEIAEVLWVEDEKSYEHMTQASGLQWSVRLRLEREVRLCGAPVDHYRLDDLLEMDLSRYKFIVFTHAFLMPPALWKKLRARIRPDAHILWNYGAAMLSPAFDPENQKAVTGFYTQACPGRMQPEELYRHINWHSVREIPNDYPLYEILPEAGQEVLQTSPDHHILTARMWQGKGASIFSVERTVRASLLRRLMRDAGVNFQGPEDCSVLADEKLIGFFPRYDVSFTYTFDGIWRNVLTDEQVSGETLLNIRGKSLKLFEKVE